MPYRITIAPRAARDLAALAVRDRRRIGRRIDALATDPRPPGSLKLAGSDSVYRFRAGDQRVVYEIRDDVLLVLVVMIRHRSRVYEELRRLLA